MRPCNYPGGSGKFARLPHILSHSCLGMPHVAGRTRIRSPGMMGTCTLAVLRRVPAGQLGFRVWL